MNDITSNLHAGQERLARDLRTVVDDAEALLRHAVRDAGQGYADARARLEQSLVSAREELATLEHAVADKLRQAGHATDAYVHEKPWQAIGVGAGVGLLVGLLLGRR